MRYTQFNLSLDISKNFFLFLIKLIFGAAFGVIFHSKKKLLFIELSCPKELHLYIVVAVIFYQKEKKNTS